MIMSVYYSILTVIYLAIVAIVSIFIVWNVIKTKKVTDKVIGAIALVMFVLRLLLIK